LHLDGEFMMVTFKSWQNSLIHVNMEEVLIWIPRWLPKSTNRILYIKLYQRIQPSVWNAQNTILHIVFDPSAWTFEYQVLEMPFCTIILKWSHSLICMRWFFHRNFIKLNLTLLYEGNNNIGCWESDFKWRFLQQVHLKMRISMTGYSRPKCHTHTNPYVR
jgi:hypothetical protein